MTDPLKDWDELKSEWQSYQPDMQAIKKKINWVTWRMRLVLFVDVLILLSYFPFMLYVIGDKAVTRLELLFYVFLGFLVIYGVYLDFKIRLPIFRAQGDTTKDVLALYLNRVKAGIKLATLSYWVSIFLFVFLSVFITARYFLSAEPDIDRLWKGLLFSIFWLGGFVGGSVWYRRKKIKELKQLNKLWKDFLD